MVGLKSKYACHSEFTKKTGERVFNPLHLFFLTKKEWCSVNLKKYQNPFSAFQ